MLIETGLVPVCVRSPGHCAGFFIAPVSTNLLKNIFLKHLTQTIKGRILIT